VNVNLSTITEHLHHITSHHITASQFLEDTKGQLTVYGLRQLKAKLSESDLVVFFRNNHFSVLHKYNGSSIIFTSRNTCYAMRYDYHCLYCDLGLVFDVYVNLVRHLSLRILRVVTLFLCV
jgi:hypothetical protein